MTDSQPITQAVDVGWRSRFSPRPGLERLRDSWVPVAQIVVAATVAYLIGVHVLGHAAPLIAITVAISSLGLARDARPLRVVETVIGMLTGILVSEALRLLTGTGTWQLAAALGVTLLVARFLSPTPGFAIAAAIQATIAMVLPASQIPFTRLLDGIAGGVLAVLVTALLPRDPQAHALRDAKAYFAAFDAAAARLVAALRRGDRLRAESGLEKARALEAVGTVWRDSLESGRSIARVSPFLQGRRAELERHALILNQMDLVTRSLRVVARRVVYLTDDRQPLPVVADTLADIAAAAALVGASIDDPAQRPAARDAVRAIAQRLDPAALLPGAPLGQHALLSALRPMVVDLLIATGMSPAEARAVIPRI